ncbi:MAG: putative toxin-antitoxin system toxin component, PIN family [Deltaproteobacteria bacterium HGW-Deltaproteobacteria-12]|nr:MAG: putative toxin-antitoxin system toxin component, PIN family [Deltaproteobacteria bacterium HGW-Deltaproteobacteria-12]
MRAVFDTNVLIAAFLTDGLCAKLLMRARRNEFSLILCPFILQEFQKFLRNKIKASSQEIDMAVKLLEEAASEINQSSVFIERTCRDEDDDNIIRCALASKSDYLVTGDDDLLTLHKYRKTKIIKPRQFESLFIHD